MATRRAASLTLWLVTITSIALLVVTVKAYQRKGNFTSADKATFNTLTLILTFLLGLSFVKSFQELAKALGPTLSKRTKGDAKVKQLLERSAESLWGVCKLWWISCRTSSFKLALFAAAWISLNILAGLIVAAANLTFTVNDGKDYNGTYVNNGTVSVTDLTCYFRQKDCPDQVAIQTIAHAYGEMILAFEPGPYNDSAKSSATSTITDQRQVAYRFNEYNPQDIQKVYPYFTDRTITAEARDCTTYKQTSDDNKDPKTLTYVNDADAADNGSISIPQNCLGREGTTYVYRGFHDPTNADLQSCGSRCLYMWAYRNPSGFPIASPEPPAFYKCAVNISEVYNSSRREHAVPDQVAKMAAASIALQGQYTGPVDKPGKQDFTLYHFYATGSPWDIHRPPIPSSASYVGDRFALFALGSLANMATFNPPIQIPGNLSHLGHSITTSEPWFTIIWIGIAGAHLGVLVAVVLFERAVQAESQELEMAGGDASNVALVPQDENADQDGNHQEATDTREITSTERSVSRERGAVAGYSALN